MTRWEYHYESASTYEKGEGNGELPPLKTLDALGAEGWELVGIAPEWGNDPLTFVFKRPIPS